MDSRYDASNFFVDLFQPMRSSLFCRDFESHPKIEAISYLREGFL